LRFIRLEDDKRIQDRAGTSTKSDYKQGSSFKNNKSKPYTRTDNHNVHADEEDEDDEDYPLISEYCFSVDTGGLMLDLQGLGEKAR